MCRSFGLALRTVKHLMDKQKQIKTCTSRKPYSTVPGDDVEVVRPVGQSFLEPRASSHHPAGVTSFCHRNPERALGNWRVVIQNVDTVDA